MVLVVLALDAVWAGLAVRGHLQSARDNLVAAGDLLANGQLDESAAHLAEARRAAHAIGSFGAHPSVWIAGHLPWIADNVAAVKALGDSAELAAGAGEAVIGAVDDAGWSGSGIPGFSGSDALAKTQLAGIAPELDRAASTLTLAEQLLAGVPTEGLLGPIRDAVVTSRGKLAGNAKLLGNATDIAGLLPDLLANGKRYLLLGQNLDEPRGTGGFIGFYGFLGIKDGRMRLERFVSAAEFMTPEPVGLPVDAPTEYRKRWQDLYALTDVRQSNYEPDLPTTGDVILQFAKAYGWGKFDGIIMVDQVWMSYMLGVAGAIETPAWPEPISTSNALQVLGHDVFFVGDLNGNGNYDESNAAQGAIAEALWTAIETRDLPPAPFAEAVSRSIAERHLQLYASDPKVERLIADLGAAGDTRLGKNPIYVTWSALSANKLAGLQDRRVDVDVSIDDQGTATVTTTLRDVNHSPAGLPGEFYDGGNLSFPAGAFACYVSVYLPEEIEGYPSFEASGQTVTGLQQDQGRPVAIGLVNPPPGGEYTWSVTYTTREAVTNVGGAKEYRLDFLPQPTVVPITLSVKMQIPGGAEVTAASPGMTVVDSSVTFQGSPVTEQSYWVRFG